MKLFTAIYDDASILGHFLCHYHKAGITEFFIAAPSGFADTVRHFTPEYKIILFEGLDVENSMLGGTAAVTEMRRIYQGPDEWVAIVDLDEFIEFAEDISQVISAAEKEGANVVRGIMYDRFSKDGRLVDIEPGSDLSRVYPVKARFISNVMGGWDYKGVLVKGQLKGIVAHHVLKDEIMCSKTLEISHYKWCTGAIERLRARYDRLLDRGIPFAGEYKKILDHYDQHDRFAWEDFGGELVRERPERRATSGEIPEAAQPARHPRDITVEDLELAFAKSDRRDLLHELVKTSRRAFGFYPSQYSYTINYPWVAARLEDLPQRSRVLDIGAGLSPLPLWLAERGVLVDCVDSHPLVRTPPPREDWNEWGFFSYGQLHPNLAAHHCAIAEFAPSYHFDAIYSVCVIAHMPRAVRGDTLRRCRDWLQPGGRLLLAIDVIPSSDFLWNRSEGLEVEPPIQHGTVADVLDQLAELGFQMNESRVVRGVYKSRTDLLFIDCIRDTVVK
jgi:SAM-dependent methyltransferase